MNKLVRLLTLLALTTIVTGCAAPASSPAASTATGMNTAQTPASLTSMPVQPPNPTAQLDPKIAQTLTDLVQQGKLSGAVLIARDGQVLLSQGYGMANIEQKLPNTPQTKFHIGSITKQFTAMAILQLQQSGKLNVNDAVCKYFDPCPAAWQPVTLHQLLIHTSGIHDINTIPGLMDFVKKPATPLQIIRLFRDLPLDFAPGSKYSFSNSGYMLLGYIIEQVSGQPYAEFLQQNIFKPLHMNNSGYDGNYDLPGRATGYKDASTPADFVDPSIGYAAAGLYSTVGDLLLWEQALSTDKLIPQALLDKMFTPYVAVPNSILSSGYGVFIGKQFDQPWIWTGSQGKRLFQWDPPFPGVEDDHHYPRQYCKYERQHDNRPNRSADLWRSVDFPIELIRTAPAPSRPPPFAPNYGENGGGE